MRNNNPQEDFIRSARRNKRIEVYVLTFFTVTSPFLIMALLWSSKLITRAEAKDQSVELISIESKILRLENKLAKEERLQIKIRQQEIKEQMRLDQIAMKERFTKNELVIKENFKELLHSIDRKNEAILKLLKENK